MSSSAETMRERLSRQGMAVTQDHTIQKEETQVAVTMEAMSGVQPRSLRLKLTGKSITSATNGDPGAAQVQLICSPMDDTA